MDIKSLKGYAFAIISAVIYGCMPLMANYIYSDGVTPFTLVFLRNFFSLVPLGVIAYLQSGSLFIPIKLLPKISLISILGCSVTPILLFCSYQFIPSGTATVFHFVYPAFVVVGSILFCRKKAEKSSVICVVLCVLGIALFYTPGSPINFEGSFLSLASAVSFASYVIILSCFDRSGIGSFLFTFYIVLISSIVSFIVCIVTGNLALPASLFGWGMCILFSLLVTTGAVVLFQQSTFLIGGDKASILSTLEPITGLVIGAAVFNEPMGIPVIIGSLLVVSASVITTLTDINKNKKKA